MIFPRVSWNWIWNWPSGVFSQDNIDDLIKETLKDSLKELQVTLADAAVMLNSFFDKNGKVRRAYLALTGG